MTTGISIVSTRYNNSRGLVKRGCIMKKKNPGAKAGILVCCQSTLVRQNLTLESRESPPH
jgi:hypothetical protein